MRSIARALLVASLIAPALAPAALAQYEHEHGHGHGREHGPWHGDIRHFRDQDFGRWRGGQWFHGPHDGRNGWWWTVGSQWYFYPAPVYPYPDPYIPPVVDVPPPAPAQTWYYCANPQGYYPYVAQCAVPWQPQPAR